MLCICNNMQTCARKQIRIFYKQMRQKCIIETKKPHTMCKKKTK